MALIYVGIGFVLVVAIVGTVVAVRSGLRVYRDLRSLVGSSLDALDGVAQQTERLGANTARAGERAERVSRSLERLSHSRAQLDVLTSALRRVRTQATRAAWVYPRK